MTANGPDKSLTIRDLLTLLPEIRIFLELEDGSGFKELDKTKSLVVPRVDDHVCIQHNTYLIYQVKWTFISILPYVDIYVINQELA